MKKFLILFLMLCVNLSAQAQTAEIVADINTGKEPPVFADNSVPLGSVLITSSSSAALGSEPYFVDSVAGTHGFIKDIFPGVGGSSPDHLVALNGNVYFTAYDGSKYSIWRTDGSEGGTLDVLSHPSCAGITSVSGLTAIDLSGSDLLAFTANSPGAGFELWFYKLGTGECTLYDLAPASTSSSPSGLRFFSEAGFNRLVFDAYRDTDGREPWFATFTASDVNVVNRYADLVSGVGVSSSPSAMLYLSAPNKLVLAANNSLGNRRIYSISDVDTFSEFSPALNFAYELTRLSSSRAVFSAFTAAAGTELWTTDGTDGGTALLSNIRPGALGSTPTGLTPLAGKVIFTASDGTTGTEPFVTDGTGPGTVQLEDLYVGTEGSDPADFTPLGSNIYFTAKSSSLGLEVWKTDGSSISIAADIEPGIAGSAARIIGATNSKLLALADQGDAGQIFAVDNAGASALATTTGDYGRSSSPSKFLPLGNSGSVLFRGNSVRFGYEPYSIDVNGNVNFIGDIVPGSNGLGTEPGATLANGKSIFRAITDENGAELWISDGTAAGTKLLKDIEVGSDSSYPSDFIALGDFVVFTATTVTTGTELWRTDGTESGTVMIADLNPGSGTGASGNPIVFDNKVYFHGRNASTGFEVFRTDGNTIELVQDFIPGSTTFPIDSFAQAAGKLFIFGDTGIGNRILTYTPGGSLIQHPGSPDNATTGVASGERVFFTGSEPFSGEELYVWNGGVVSLVKDINPGSDSSSIEDMLPISGGRVLFEAYTPEHGSELWVSDGSEAGTQRLTDENPGSDDSYLEIVGSDGTHGYYSIDSNTLGSELLISDGTLAGTSIKDLNPGDANSYPEYGFYHFGVFYFSAYNNQTGREPYRIVWDACFLDEQKTSPGVCGCGSADVDTNTNGVVDCLLSPELIALINTYLDKLKKVSIKEPSNAAQTQKLRRAKRAANAAKKAVIEHINANNSSINKVDAVKFNKFFGQLKKFGKAAIKAPSAESKKKASGAAKRLRAQIVT